MRFDVVSGKARIAGNSWTIGKIRNAAGGRFGLIDAVHELIRGSLSLAGFFNSLPGLLFYRLFVRYYLPCKRFLQPYSHGPESDYDVETG